MKNQLQKIIRIKHKFTEKIVAPIRKRQQMRVEQANELEILFGEQDAIDILSYAGLEENADYLCIDGEYIRTLHVSGYPFVAHSGWLDNLINFNYNNDISIHLHEMSALSALPKLNRKITELESTKRAMISEGKIVSSEITEITKIGRASCRERV